MAKLLAAKETAAELRVHPGTVHRWIRERRMPHVRVGHHGLIRLKRADLMVMVGASEDEPA